MKPTLLFPVLALFVLLPLLRFVQAPGVDSVRTVDAVSLYASGMALGALLATIIASRRRSRA